MSGGKSIGKQREAINPNQAAPRTPPAAAAGDAEHARAAASRARRTCRRPQPSGMSRWLGPLAGLAIGAGLASLFFNNGHGRRA